MGQATQNWGCSAAPPLHVGAYVPGGHPSSTDVRHGAQDGAVVPSGQAGQGNCGLCAQGSHTMPAGSCARRAGKEVRAVRLLLV